MTASCWHKETILVLLELSTREDLRTYPRTNLYDILQPHLSLTTSWSFLFMWPPLQTEPTLFHMVFWVTHPFTWQCTWCSCQSSSHIYKKSRSLAQACAQAHALPLLVGWFNLSHHPYCNQKLAKDDPGYPQNYTITSSLIPIVSHCCRLIHSLAYTLQHPQAGQCHALITHSLHCLLQITNLQMCFAIYS